MDLREQYRAMSLDILKATLERGKLNEEEAQICKEVIAEKTNTAAAQTSLTQNNTTEGSDYGTAIFMAKFLSFLGWVVIIIGIGVAITIFATSASMFRYAGWETIAVAIASAFSPVLAGVFMVVSGQAARAVMDNANYSKMMLDRMESS